MINIASAKLIISFLTFLFAYVVVVTIAGAFRAWVAKRMGDDTADQMGFLTLNPFMHIDVIGVIFLVLFYFGWGRYVPVNPFAIHDPWRRLKLVTAYLSDTIAYFVSALIGITILVSAFGLKMLYTTQSMLICIQRMTHLYLVDECPTLSSMAITISFIIIAFVYLNVILGVLNFILNSFSLLMYLFFERSSRYSTYNYYVIVLVPIILIFLLSEPLRLFAIHMISYAGFAIARMFGLV